MDDERLSKLWGESGGFSCGDEQRWEASPTPVQCSSPERDKNDSYRLTFKRQSGSALRMCCFMKRADLQSNPRSLAQHSRPIKHNLYQMRIKTPALFKSPKDPPSVSRGTFLWWRWWTNKCGPTPEEQQTIRRSVSSDNVHFLSQSNHNPFKQLIHFRWKSPETVDTRLPLEFSKTLPHPFSQATYSSITTLAS